MLGIISTFLRWSISPVIFIYNLLHAIISHTIIIPLKLFFKISIYIPFLKIPVIVPLIYLLELHEIKDTKWILTQIELFSITTLHFLIVCIILGGIVGTIAGINMSAISIVLSGEPLVSTPAATTATTTTGTLGKPSVKTIGVDKSKLEQVWEKSIATGVGNENEGLGIKKKLEEVIIPDILPNLSKSRIQLKLKQQQQQQQQIQKLKEQQGMTLRNPEFNDTQKLRNEKINISDELGGVDNNDNNNNNEIHDIDDIESTGIEVVGLEDDGYAYTGGLRNRNQYQYNTHLQKSDKNASKQKITARASGHESLNSPQIVSSTTGRKLKDVNDESSTDSKTVKFAEDLVQEQPIGTSSSQRKAPTVTFQEEQTEKEQRNQLRGVNILQENEEVSSTDEGALSNIPEETETETETENETGTETEEIEDHMFTQGESVTEDTSLY
ncbi:conserved hypothetical protein [Candida dubliniensis CD36]|uniref:Uncharacterized protein n=1 Tax=Candida dubliniensis (strain CD36 / ATCC MYA-646 / CBS 7987 / NCPF 3949 / NRRL Y-17841) TaxID=573826 RepID=B9WM18_CANDC|nr:conserved hypothetical protein [Candida dubliniensis CD36]CAX40131.1 conserved hypothetical protein [Candida dubliniensis CD36]